MFRTFSYAAAAATLAATAFAPTAIAESKTVNVNIEAARIIDASTAQDALRSLEFQAKKACRYEVNALKRKKTDWVCANDVVQQVVTQLDIPHLTAAYAKSDMLVRVADRSASEGALQ